MKLIPVNDNPNLARDVNSGAILNINKQEVERARQRKAQRAASRSKAQQLEQKVEVLSDEISDIKQMLQTLLGQKV